jgi:hypothetical protein
MCLMGAKSCTMEAPVSRTWLFVVRGSPGALLVSGTDSILNVGFMRLWRSFHFALFESTHVALQDILVKVR